MTGTIFWQSYNSYVRVYVRQDGVLWAVIS
jgi:hypothetical protein